MLRAVLSLCLLPALALAAPPKVATDITPVHSLVASVMQGVGSPALLIQSGASPHGYTLRPSEAQALQDADVVFWMSEDLTPWLEGSIASLAKDAINVELLETEGTLLHDIREGATFEAHDHHDDDHGHDEHHDPHAWLDPENAKVWLNHIAEELARLDSANAETYRRNAATTRQQLTDLQAELEQRVEGLAGVRFIVFHDAYQYFERRFGLVAQGAISIGDASDPSPARIKKLRDVTESLDIRCVFTEPQYNPGLVKSVFAPTQIRATPVMDPLGARLQPGTSLYSEVLRGLVRSVEECADAT
ncbi:MAG: zinc ABC transporter substrate-binding protein [Marinobacter sp.]|uniref:zinc ABC transporter substrate-binding protein n=1 Tax=Marinobacter sp. TaxID=50741 RepID=UPI0034A08A4B